MSRRARDEASGRGVDRLVYGYVRGRRRGARRTALAIATARFVDEALGRSGVAKPVLLVSGFWRSGTTWLQESLAAALGGKTVFEPLSPMEPHRRAAMMREWPGDTEDLRQATIPGPQPIDAAFWLDLDRTSTGARSSSYLLSCRQGIAESWRPAIVVKDVRLQANLQAFHLRYGTPVVHIRRHPCAVVASVTAADWHWSFARAPLADLLPRLGDALSGPERAAALRFDTDAPSRIAALWAVSERLAAAALDGQRWGLVQPYEDFATRPDAALARLCGKLSLPQRHGVDFAAPSATVDPKVFAASGASVQDRWRTVLSRAEIDRVEAVVDAIYPDWRSAAGGGSTKLDV